MTESEWLEEFTSEWGEDYVESLIEQGYRPVHTDRGWRWIQENSLVTA